MPVPFGTGRPVPCPSISPVRSLSCSRFVLRHATAACPWGNLWTHILPTQPNSVQSCKSTHVPLSKPNIQKHVPDMPLPQLVFALVGPICKHAGFKKGVLDHKSYLRKMYENHAAALCTRGSAFFWILLGNLYCREAENCINTRIFLVK